MPQLDLTPGAEIPTFTRKADLDAWNRYAAVNDEFVPIHMDDEAGREAGFPTAVGMGNLAFSYLHNLLRAWIGETGRIARISVQYRQPVLRKTTVTARGKIISAEGPRAELQIWIEDDGGRTLLEGQATVVVAA